MSNIKQLLDKNNQEIYPVTHLTAVFDNEGNDLNTKLTNIDNELNESASQNAEVNTRLTNVENELNEVVAQNAEINTKLTNNTNVINNLTLGVHTDGLMYIFKDGVPIGNGVTVAGETGDVVGNVDSANNIVLYGNLPNGAYSVQYELEDGTLVNIGTLNVDENGNTDEPTEPEERPLTNLIPLSVDNDGGEFVGTNGEDGYMTGYRIKSDGSLAAADSCVTGFIPVAPSDIIRIKNFEHCSNPSSGYDRIVFYDSSKNFLAHATLMAENVNITIDGDIYSTKPDQTTQNAAFFRVAAGTINEDTIITVNQEIPSDYTGA